MNIMQLEYAYQKAKQAAFRNSSGTDYWYCMAHLRMWYRWRAAKIATDRLIERWSKDNARKPCG